MIQIDDKLISLDVIDEQFVCDLAKCKGECCISGDAGAPLEENELFEIEDAFPTIRNMLSEDGKKSIENYGLYTKDQDGDWVTPLVNGNKECAYVIFEKGVATCTFEKAHSEGKISFRKPISCHLYPIRIKKLKNYEAVNYDRWDICSAACTLGKTLKVPVYKFLKDALIRKYGAQWYLELELAVDHYSKSKA